MSIRLRLPRESPREVVACLRSGWRRGGSNAPALPGQGAARTGAPRRFGPVHLPRFFVLIALRFRGFAIMRTAVLNRSHAPCSTPGNDLSAFFAMFACRQPERLSRGSEDLLERMHKPEAATFTPYARGSASDAYDPHRRTVSAGASIGDPANIGPVV